MKKHIAVLLSEVISYLDPRPNENFIDATLGLGGHAEKILAKTGPRGKLLGIDWDESNLTQAKNHLKKFKDRCQFFRDNFSNLSRIIKISKFKKIKGILLDLGLSTTQLENPIYGLSFKNDQPLDMRMDGRLTITAEQIIRRYPFKKIADILYHYGDIRNSYQIAKKIVDARQREEIKTTLQLVKAIGISNLPRRGRVKAGPKVLAPIFQALRIEVNRELDNLEKALPQIVNVLKKGGRMVVISYHSGEDRIVKNFLRINKDHLKILTKKPIMAGSDEIKNNPRSRSAKLRAAEKIC